LQVRPCCPALLVSQFLPGIGCMHPPTPSRARFLQPQFVRAPLVQARIMCRCSHGRIRVRPRFSRRTGCSHGTRVRARHAARAVRIPRARVRCSCMTRCRGLLRTVVCFRSNVPVGDVQPPYWGAYVDHGGHDRRAAAVPRVGARLVRCCRCCYTRARALEASITRVALHPTQPGPRPPPPPAAAPSRGGRNFT
jgi:hypothetical protein